MKTFEIDIEVKVRKTLLVAAHDENFARDAALLLLHIMAVEPGGVEFSTFLKWSDGRRAHRPVPVETVIGPEMVISGVREVPDV